MSATGRSASWQGLAAAALGLALAGPLRAEPPETAVPTPPRELPQNIDAIPIDQAGADPLPEPPLPNIALTAATAEVSDEGPSQDEAIEAAPPPPDGLGPISFQGVTPGQSTVEQVRQRLGEPAAMETTEQGPLWTYQVGPFPRIEVAIIDDVVQSILVQVAGDPTIVQMVRDLNIGTIRAATIYDRHGEPIGLAFPERGVMMAIEQLQEQSVVRSVLAEPVQAELFVLRARNESERDGQRRLKDLNTALELDSRHAEACGLKARLLTSVGEYEQAEQLAERAVQADPAAADWKLLLARVRMELQQWGDARREALGVLQDEENPQIVRAAAACLAADIQWLEGDCRGALENHLQSIQLAASHRGSQAADLRREALRVLVEAHLGAANDIAWGQWKNKQKAISKWIGQARHFADMLVKQENEDALFNLHVHRLMLSAYAPLEGSIDTRDLSQQALEQGRQLLQSSEDPLYSQRVQWELARTMHAAVRALRNAGALPEAVKCAKAAAPLFQAAARRRDLTGGEQFMIAEMHFLAGSCLAVADADHAGAVRWYDSGAHQLAQQFPPHVVKDIGLLGDQLVSMGVSYWEAGKQERAVEMTQQGVKRLQQAAQQGDVRRESLTIAYRNLASMLKAQGKQQEASQATAQVTALETAGSAPKQK